MWHKSSRAKIFQPSWVLTHFSTSITALWCYFHILLFLPTESFEFHHSVDFPVTIDEPPQSLFLRNINDRSTNNMINQTADITGTKNLADVNLFFPPCCHHCWMKWKPHCDQSSHCSSWPKMNLNLYWVFWIRSSFWTSSRKVDQINLKSTGLLLLASPLHYMSFILSTGHLV